MDFIAEKLVRLAVELDELGDLERLGENIPPSPIDGFSNQRARRYVQKYLGNNSGMFRDSGWEAVDRIFKRLREDGGLNVEGWAMNDATHEHGYYYDRNDGHIAGKAWEFAVSFFNDRGRPTEIKGTIIASFGGTVEQHETDYLGEDRPYDLAAYVY